MPKRMRLPNGFGQITKIKNRNLRKPWRARVHIEWTKEGKQRAETIGYFKSYNEAYAALIKYHESPTGYVSASVSVSELFFKWLEYYERQNGLSQIRVENLRSRFRRSGISNMIISEVRPADIRDDVLRDSIPPTIKVELHGIYKNIFRYAVNELILERSPAESLTLPRAVSHEILENKTIKTAFTPEEIELIRADDSLVAKILLYSFYSGWRPSEVLALKTEDINFDVGYAKGGSKTSNGKNRLVPIHEDIRDLLYNAAAEAQGGFLFPLKYSTYISNVKKLLKRLNISPHTPHDARRTFITIAKKCGLDEYAIKRIVGHSIRDITENVYTDRPFEFLASEMAKFKL